jgi:hypothetical protein
MEGSQDIRGQLEPHMVQKTESLLSGRFTIVEIEHTTKPFTTLNGLID